MDGIRIEISKEDAKVLHHIIESSLDMNRYFLNEVFAYYANEDIKKIINSYKNLQILSIRIDSVIAFNSKSIEGHGIKVERLTDDQN